MSSAGVCEAYQRALEQIAALADVTEARGEFENMAAPAHMIDDEGWGPIHPRVKQGLNYAARIARAALEKGEEDGKEV